MTEIKEYEGKLPVEIEAEIVALSKICKISEDYDLACDLVYIWVKDGKIVGVIAYKREYFDDGRVIPRIEHIFGTIEVRKTISGVKFLRYTEKALMARGFNQITAYITNKEYMREYALKDGYVEYSEKCFVKNLGG